LVCRAPYLGLVAREQELGATNSQRFGLSHQIGQRPRTHLLYDMPAMDLHGNFGKSEFGRYLFVHEARRYQSQNLALARGKVSKWVRKFATILSASRRLRSPTCYRMVIVIEWSFHHQFYRSAKTEHTAHLAFLLSWAPLGFGLKVDLCVPKTLSELMT
jgi:hypothetical protein